MRLLQLLIQLPHLTRQLLDLALRLLLLLPKRELVLPLKLLQPLLQRRGFPSGGFGTGRVVVDLLAQGVELGLAVGVLELFAALFVAGELLRGGDGGGLTAVRWKGYVGGK